MKYVFGWFALVLAFAGALFSFSSLRRGPETLPVAPVAMAPEKRPVAMPVAQEARDGTAATSSPMVALTFDDGPYGTSTAEILDILKREKVSATFFLLGMNATRFPEQARRIAEEGHAIGNHSFAHSDRLAKASADAFLADVDAAEDAIASSTGVRPSLYRPPYGSISPVMREVLRRNGYRNVLWNVDPRDWDEASTAEEIVERVLADAKPNAIILLHDGRDTHVNFSRANLVRALPKVIAGLRARGYRLVTIEALR